MTDYIFLTACNRCYKQQQILSRGKRPKGSRTCVFCGKNFTLNRETIIRRIK